MRTFLPKSHYLPDGNSYRPLYKWHREDNWTLVPGRKTYPTSKAATDAADEYLARGMNKVRAETCSPEPDEAVIDIGIDEWRRQKAQEAAEERAAVFGADASVAVFRKGRMIPVERRRARA